MSVIDATKVANRALQHVGSTRIAAGALLTENSKAADEIRSCYDILRRAELRRNVWRFSIRRIALRAFDANTKQLTFAAYAAGTTYKQNDVVVASDGQAYTALVGANVGNDPVSTLGKWTLYFGAPTAYLYDSTAGISFYVGEIVYSGGTSYFSLVSGNQTNPTTDLTGSWLTFTAQPTLTSMNFAYPIGSGPSNESTTRNVFMLPVGFLREAPQDPKAAQNAFLGGPAGLRYNDWYYENQCFTSFDVGPILFRFASDVSDPTMFDPLFVEGFACRVGLEVCEALTQSTEKLSGIEQKYRKFMGEARTVNGIEEGPVDAPLDEYLTVRI